MSVGNFTVGMGNTQDCSVVCTQPGGVVTVGLNRRGGLRQGLLFWLPYENIKRWDNQTFNLNDVLSIRGNFTMHPFELSGFSICAYATKILKVKIITGHSYQPYVRPITQVPAIQNVSVKPLQVNMSGKTGYLIADKAVLMMYTKEMNVELQALKEISIIHDDSYFIPMENQARMFVIRDYISHKFPEFMKKDYITLVTL